MKKSIGLFIVLSLLFTFASCQKSNESEETAKPTATVTVKIEPTATPVPTATPEPDVDIDVDAILYRFAYEGEEIVDSMFNGIELKAYNSSIEYTKEGLLITVEGLADPYVFIPVPAGEDSINVQKYPILKMVMKNSSKQPKGEFYIGFDGEGIEDFNQYYPFDLEVTDDWQTVYLDFSEIKPEAQRITAFRADIVNEAPVDSTIVLDFLGFFPSREAAEAYISPNHR